MLSDLVLSSNISSEVSTTIGVNTVFYSSSQCWDSLSLSLPLLVLFLFTIIYDCQSSSRILPSLHFLNASLYHHFTNSFMLNFVMNQLNVIFCRWIRKMPIEVWFKEKILLLWTNKVIRTVSNHSDTVRSIDLLAYLFYRQTIFWTDNFVGILTRVIILLEKYRNHL